MPSHRKTKSALRCIGRKVVPCPLHSYTLQVARIVSHLKAEQSQEGTRVRAPNMGVQNVLRLWGKPQFNTMAHDFTPKSCPPSPDLKHVGHGLVPDGRREGRGSRGHVHKSGVKFFVRLRGVCWCASSLEVTSPDEDRSHNASAGQTAPHPRETTSERM